MSHTQYMIPVKLPSPRLMASWYYGILNILKNNCIVLTSSQLECSKNNAIVVKKERSFQTMSNVENWKKCISDMSGARTERGMARESAHAQNPGAKT